MWTYDANCIPFSAAARSIYIHLPSKTTNYCQKNKRFRPPHPLPDSLRMFPGFWDQFHQRSSFGTGDVAGRRGGDFSCSDPSLGSKRIGEMQGTVGFTELILNFIFWVTYKATPLFGLHWKSSRDGQKLLGRRQMHLARMSWRGDNRGEFCSVRSLPWFLFSWRWMTLNKHTPETNRNPAVKLSN